LKPETIGLLSGILVIISAIPYIIRTYQKKIRPNITSWSLWTVMGLAILITYRSSGAKDNAWPAMFGFTNPLIITIIALLKKGERKKMEDMEKVCLVFGLLAIILWIAVRTQQELVQYALYLAIIADACAAVPTLFIVWKEPDADRPFAWGMFGIAYAVSIFAITEHKVSNYALPIYMALAALSITLPLAWHRWKTKAPLSEWI
jgi:uncharacterized membrane protein HdeD (DUF308 family)